jgi:putative phage-type endonuclease
MTLELVQGSAEWHAYRCGKVTASRVADVIAKTKTGWGASRANYAAQLIAERLTGTAADSYTNAAMQWGTDTEPQARLVYEMMSDVSVEQVGLIPHPTIAMSCASPDGLVGTDGLVEIKCPNTATHIETLLSEAVQGKYITQMQWQMACSGRAWCDFVSFDPRMPGEMQLFVSRVMRDDAAISELTTQIEVFLAEVADTVSRLQAKYGLKEAA